MSLPELADAFVLAGGQSTRMGQDKSLLTLNGAPLIERALTILRSAGLQPRIAGTRSPELMQFAPVVPDDPATAGLGPLSGICSALSLATHRYSVFIPVDLPLLPPSLIVYLIEHALLTEAPVTTVTVAGFHQTFPAVLDRAAAPHLRAALASGQRKCISAYCGAAAKLSRPAEPLPLELLVQAGQVSHPGGLPPHAWFHNLNTPADVSRLGSFLVN